MRTAPLRAAQCKRFEEIMKSSLRMAAGVAGAVAGYIVIFVLFSLLELGTRADPITCVL